MNAPSDVNHSVRQDRCPGCETANFVNTGPPSNGFSNIVRGREFRQDAYRARRCRQCGLVFKSVIAAPEVLSDYYMQVDFRKWEIPGLFPTEQAVCKLLNALPPRARVLDFGCSTGRLISRLVGRLDCYGFEINTEAAAIASSKGVKIVGAELLSGSTMASFFDTVTAIDVFEHLASPTDLIARLISCLRPSGQLLLVTGNADNRAAVDDLANFWYFRTVEHLCMMTRQYAEYVATKLGLELVGWKRMSHYEASVYIKVLQHSQNLAFKVFHRDRSPWIKPLMAKLPHFNKAKNWSVPPPWTVTRDHVLAIFRKPADSDVQPTMIQGEPL